MGLKDTNTQVPKVSKQFTGIGVSNGLSVSININASDYFYTSLSAKGCMLKIFLPGDFPDLISGSLRQIIVQENSEVFLKVEPNVLQTYGQVRSLKKKQRKCKFSDEEKTAFGLYTSSNCFVTCKLTSMHFLCNCIPVVLPIAEFKIEKEDVMFCNLVDIPCLNRYQGKWLRYYPQEGADLNELSLDREDSLSCSHCYPNCDDVTYSIDTNYFEFFSNNPQYPNQSRIHVFSNKAYSNLYKKFVTVTWYEALSTFGGIVSILLGVSIINFVEIGILVVKLFINNCKIKK
ncbi:pickpocket protein 11-like [Anthonomus grandis grandis]|uniref:pickpocket protein 11-like n=1 Tax=Anthonomus grandis grandis TaxID=2921223 RepID=UPI0021662035|nr:pickpocket protein 11-like [Anthonomus grandis grandis]